jgi:hypothetical protein
MSSCGDNTLLSASTANLAASLDLQPAPSQNVLPHYGAGYADVRLPAAQGQPCSDMQHQQGCFDTPGVQASPQADTACTADSAKASRSTGGCRAAAGAAPGRPQVGLLTKCRLDMTHFHGLLDCRHDAPAAFALCTYCMQSHSVAEGLMLHSSATAPARFCAQ